MIHTLVKNWWLLALCGILDAIMSAIYFNYAEGGFHAMRPVVWLGTITLAGGACTIAAGIWSSRIGRYWLLVLNGVACGALGLTFTFWKRPLAFTTVALLIAVMAISIGVYELAAVRTWRRHPVDEWLLGAAGVASLGFALAFLAFVFRWIELEPGSPGQTLRWLGSYFGFCAICMTGLALRWQRGAAFPSAGNPSHAH